MLYLITYDLNAKGQNYDALYDEIKKADGWCHLMESVWLIHTTASVQAWYDKLKAVIDDNDELFVVNITKQTRQGWIAKNNWEWIDKHDY